ncbi:MAG: glycosyltransferase family 4 protein, partial [Leptolyngbya sp. SIO1D8]|nr:glycosyltransferase family 4 protein [Leptolyngbya sp. SIO1D8]
GHQEMPSHIAAAHILVVPQRDDPATKAQFPLKITDGMAMAKPVLATRVGDIPKILGETGYLVKSDSPDALAEGIRHIFSDYNLALERGYRARIRCKEHYSLECMGKILSNVFKAKAHSMSP